MSVFHRAVSPSSAKESSNLLTNDFGYFLFTHDSLIFAGTDLEDLLIWSTKEYFSSLGKDLVISKISPVKYLIESGVELSFIICINENMCK